MSSVSGFEVVIGLEVHVQLATESKLFCGCRSRLAEGESVADLVPNSQTCPICTGQPGTLPVINKKAVEYAIKVGSATHCKIHSKSIFARKNYFYPDLPKGYQISQYENPICEKGWLDVEWESVDGSQSTKKVGITRIHIEEDAGKSVHKSNYSLVNLNRSGTPLVEVVSEPDLRTPEEAGAYLRELYSIVTYLGACDGNLQEGNFRCDANVSVRPQGQKEFGTRVEIKNINSFRFVEKAISYESHRQIECLQSGEKIVQETRLYDADKNQTFSMRSKEEAHDYRYFPDPDLIPLILDSAWIEKIQADLPSLPQEIRKKFIDHYELSFSDASLLTSSKDITRFFQEVIDQIQKAYKMEDEVKKCAKQASRLVNGEILRLTNESSGGLKGSYLKPKHLADVIFLLEKNEISSTAAKKILSEAWKTGEVVSKIVDQLGLKQVSDLSALEPLVEEVIRKFPDQVEQFRSGKEKIIGFFVGQLMKTSKGQGNPSLFQELLRKKLKK